MSAINSGTACRYQYVFDAGRDVPEDTCESSGIRRSMSVPGVLPVDQRPHSQGMSEIVRPGPGAKRRGPPSRSRESASGTYR